MKTTIAFARRQFSLRRKKRFQASESRGRKRYSNNASDLFTKREKGLLLRLLEGGGGKWVGKHCLGGKRTGDKATNLLDHVKGDNITAMLKKEKESDRGARDKKR